MIIQKTWTDTDRLGAPVTVRQCWWWNQPEQVAFLRQMVSEYRNRYPIRELAKHIIFDWARVPAKRKLAQSVAIGRWVQGNIQYLNEGDETFQTPLRTLVLKAGDCDDFSTLIGSLLESVGIPCELVALKWDGSYRHIFPRAVVRYGARVHRLPLDATVSVPAGKINPIRIAARKHPDLEYLAL